MRNIINIELFLPVDYCSAGKNEEIYRIPNAPKLFSASLECYEVMALIEESIEHLR